MSLLLLTHVASDLDVAAAVVAAAAAVVAYVSARVESVVNREQQWHPTTLRISGSEHLVLQGRWQMCLQWAMLQLCVTCLPRLVMLLVPQPQLQHRLDHPKQRLVARTFAVSGSQALGMPWSEEEQFAAENTGVAHLSRNESVKLQG